MPGIDSAAQPVRTRRRYELLLLLAAAIWGLSFVVLRSASVELPATYVVGVRYLFAGVITAVALRRRLRERLDRRHLAAGVLLGVLVYFGFLLMSVSAMGTTPGKNAFLTTSYCVLVPFLAYPLTRRAPRAHNVVAGLVCLAGIALISLKVTDAGLSFGQGEALAIAAAVFLGLHMVFVPRFAESYDMLVLTTVQFLTSGVMGFAIGFATVPLPVATMLEPSVLGDLLYLVVLSTCVGSLLQNVCQSHVPAAQASLIISTESVFGLVFGVLLVGERATLPEMAGFALIACAIVLNELGYRRAGREELL